MRALWYADDCVHRLLHALETATRAVQRLATNGYTDPVNPSLTVLPEKVISETALLLVAATSAEHIPEVRTAIKHTAEILLPHARSERMLLGICLEPPLALDYAQAHVCLKRLGYPDARFDKLLLASLQSQAACGHERPPHRMLEQEWIMGLWRPSHSKNDWIRRSTLNLPMDLLNGSREDIYAFTHAVMFVAYSNQNRTPRLPRTRAEILAEAEAALARCIDEQDYDLGGEVLLAWPLLGRQWQPAAAFAFRVLASVEDTAGFLPSPATQLTRLQPLNGQDRTDYLLATAYHTMYVMGLLCAAALQPGHLPPYNIPSKKTTNHAAEPILELLDADNRDTHWRDEFKQLSGNEQDALASFLLAIALRRKTQERSFSAVLDILKLGKRFGVVNTPIASQAAEMLERVALFSQQ